MGEARHQVPVQVDGVELDMRHGVQQGDAALRAARLALGHVARIQQFRCLGPGGTGRRRGGADGRRMACVARGEPRGGVAARQGGLVTPVGGRQNLDRHLGQRLHGTQSDLAASSTSSAWPGTLTLSQRFTMSP